MFRRWKFRHLAKFLSLSTDEIFTDKVFLFYPSIMQHHFYQVRISNRGCICTFLLLLEPILLLFVLDKSITLFFPHIKSLVTLNKCFYSKIHRSCFLTFKYLIRLILFSASLFLSIPFAALWYLQLVIYLSNDISKKPGPRFQNNFFNFMSWNLNSLAKDNFKRVSLIEAHNSLFNYDMISICETSLNDTVEIPEPLLNEYTFVSAINPANKRHGGVGLFYKNSLPVIVRSDLPFDESIVVELKFGRKKILFTVLYRSPASDHNSPSFQTFLLNFKNLHTKIQAENPFATFFYGRL